MKDDLNFLENGRQPNSLENGRGPRYFGKMEDKLNAKVNARQPYFFLKNKRRPFNCLQMEDYPISLLT